MHEMHKNSGWQNAVLEHDNSKECDNRVNGPKNVCYENEMNIGDKYCKRVEEKQSIFRLYISTDIYTVNMPILQMIEKCIQTISTEKRLLGVLNMLSWWHNE